MSSIGVLLNVVSFTWQKGAYGSCSTAPIATAPGQKPDKDDEPPLISFD